MITGLPNNIDLVTRKAGNALVRYWGNPIGNVVREHGKWYGVDSRGDRTLTGARTREEAARDLWNMLHS